MFVLRLACPVPPRPVPPACLPGALRLSPSRSLAHSLTVASPSSLRFASPFHYTTLLVLPPLHVPTSSFLALSLPRLPACPFLPFLPLRCAAVLTPLCLPRSLSSCRHHPLLASLPACAPAKPASEPARQPAGPLSHRHYHRHRQLALPATAAARLVRSDRGLLGLRALSNLAEGGRSPGKKRGGPERSGAAYNNPSASAAPQSGASDVTSCR